MEMEEMKAQWNTLSNEINKQKLLTDKLILNMTQDKYSRKFSRLVFFETKGAVICFIAALWVLINITKLDTWYLLILGILVILYFTIVPSLVLKSLYQMKRLKITKWPLKETLLKYTKSKQNVLLMQRLGIVGNFIILLISIPVMIKLFKNKDVFVQIAEMDNMVGLGVFVIVMGIVMVWVSKWGYGCYQKITNAAEDTIRELEE